MILLSISLGLLLGYILPDIMDVIKDKYFPIDIDINDYVVDIDGVKTIDVSKLTRRECRYILSKFKQ